MMVLVILSMNLRSHTQKGFDLFFKMIEDEACKRDATITIAMEGYNV